MARLLFRLNNVEFDEAEAVRALLCDAGYAFYETGSGMFGLSMAAIWLSDGGDYLPARELLDDFAEQRAASVRRAIAGGEKASFLQNAIRQPAKILLVAFSLIAVMYFSIWPFLSYF